VGTRPLGTPAARFERLRRQLPHADEETLRKHVAATAIPEGEDAERTAQQLPRSSERGYPERIVFSGPDLRDARFLYAQPDVYDALVARVVAVVRERPREHRPRGRARARRR
jgi:hypothetical protein